MKDFSSKVHDCLLGSMRDSLSLNLLMMVLELELGLSFLLLLNMSMLSSCLLLVISTWLMHDCME